MGILRQLIKSGSKVLFLTFFPLEESYKHYDYLLLLCLPMLASAGRINFPTFGQIPVRVQISTKLRETMDIKSDRE